MRYAICLLFAVASFTTLGGPLPSFGQPPVAPEIVRTAASFDRAHLARPDDANRVRVSGSLGGGQGVWGITGYFDFDFVITQAGWYEILLSGDGGEIMFLLDPGSAGVSISFESAQLEGSSPPKVGNLPLSIGKHTLRLQKFFWTGFPQLMGFTIRRAGGTPASSVLLMRSKQGELFRTGQCPPVRVIGGMRSTPLRLIAHIKNVSSGTDQLTSFEFPSGPALRSLLLDTKCDAPGQYFVELRDGNTPLSWRDVPPVRYEVVDTTHAVSQGSGAARTLVGEVDLVATAPPYSGGGPTRVAKTPGTLYRESSDTGFTIYQRTGALPEPSWFSYVLNGLTPQRPYEIEIDYPDDAVRTTVIALREALPRLSDVAAGYDTGGEFRTTGALLTHSLVFWPKIADPRIVFLTAHNGRRAAASRIRVYRLDGKLPEDATMQRGRLVLNYYEEGTDVVGLYGAQVTSVDAYMEALQRWPMAARYAGSNVLMPTAVAYTFATYPSQYNAAFSRSYGDYLQRVLFAAERSGMWVVPELHPRADELAWPFADRPDPKPNLLVSKDGRTNYYAADGKTRNLPPFYNPLHPANQDWYVAMIGELVDNYRDSPALLGISLRLQQWQNATLNNFNSLDWGYDDWTVRLFAQQSGIALPVPAQSSASNLATHARARYQWLMANAKEHWISWRCEKIAELYTRIRDRVRRARADLKVYSTVFSWAPDGDRRSLREAGIDPDLLSRIDGLVLVNAFPRYGRREPDAIVTQDLRDNLLVPERLDLLRPSGEPGAFLSTSNYVEATEAVAPPSALGLSKGVPGWLSASVYPAGRHVLEQYAIQLAETDAHIIGDGGNGYALGQPETRAWLREYLALPAEPFTARADARDPVAVWSLSRSDGLWLYAVNRERISVPVTIRFSGPAGVRRTTDEQIVPLDPLGQLNLRLQPYELLGFKAPVGSEIQSIAVAVPQSERSKIEVMIKWVTARATAKSTAHLSNQETALLAAAAKEASSALEQGQIWRARTRLEHHTLVAIYEKLNAYPPGLRDPGAAAP